ncbi:MAG: LPS export ABC transporter ATP-binding protein [Verrucomicrobiales bacterium]
MSYTDERDEIAELFGTDPKSKKGYSAELDKTAPEKFRPLDDSPPRTVPSAPESRPVPPLQTTTPPAASGKTVEVADPPKQAKVKKAVKLRPPSHVAPHPLEQAPPPATKPKPAASEPPVVEDEDFLVYDDAENPVFSETDFISFEEEPEAKPTPADKSSTADILIASESAAPPPPAATASSGALPARSPVSATLEAAPAPDLGTTRATTKKPLLDTNGLVKIYDGRTVVNGVDINVRPGEIVGLLGPNGAGKTTSFYMMVGLVPPNGGRVVFRDIDVTRMPMYKRARLGMGYLPQEESIFRKLTVEENIMAVMETLKIPRQEKVERCNELLERFGIGHIRKNVALTCSGGEKRRVTIARSLVTQPSLLMLDEPFSGVDPIAVNEIQTIVEDLRKSGLAILITDHNARQTLELVDRAYLIYEGKVLREGSRDFLINDPVSRELYLGDRFTM